MAPKTKKAPAGDVTSIVAPVWDNPDDDAIRAVVGDALLEVGHPWGELIALQLRGAQRKTSRRPERREGSVANDRRLAQVLAKRHRDVIGGPIAKIANTARGWVCDKGFLVECDLDRRLVKRPDYEAAQRAPHWATVKRVRVSILNTPQWFLVDWMKNPATKSLREIDVGGLLLARDAAGEPWRVAKATQSRFYVGYLVAFVKGLSADERARLAFAPNIRPNVRAELEAALANVR